MRDQTRLLKRATLSVAAVLCVALPAGAADDLRLVEAAKQRDGQALRRLLEAPNVDVNAALPDGGTALHWAVHWDDLDMVDLLVRAGADVDAANDYGIVPLVLACTNGHTAIAERLLAAGANPNKVALVGEETVLMTAARTGVAGVVNALLDHGAEVDARDGHHGQTALMWAAAEGHEAVVRTLLARGAALDARSDATGFTPLLFAARTGDLDLMRVLLAAGADVDEAANDGTTALSIATLRSDTRLGEFLLAEGADPNRGAGFAPLHWAAGSWANIGDVDDGTRRSDADDWLKFEGLTAPPSTSSSSCSSTTARIRTHEPSGIRVGGGMVAAPQGHAVSDRGAGRGSGHHAVTAGGRSRLAGGGRRRKDADDCRGRSAAGGLQPGTGARRARGGHVDPGAGERRQCGRPRRRDRAARGRISGSEWVGVHRPASCRERRQPEREERVGVDAPHHFGGHLLREHRQPQR